MSIEIEKYAELTLICWDIDCKSIERKQAFHTYVNRWSHVHQDKLSVREKALIEKLTAEFGRGHFFPRAHGRAKITKEFLKHAIAVDEIDTSIYHSFIESVLPDPSYPGVINGMQYYWRAEVDAFVNS